MTGSNVAEITMEGEPGTIRNIVLHEYVGQNHLYILLSVELLGIV